MLRREKVELSVERRVLSNLIMSTSLVAKCRKAGDPSLFESSLSRIVATWVWEFFDRFGEAPGTAISDIYQQKATDLKDADAEMVKEYLDTCSDEWIPTNVALATDSAIKYFQQRSLALLVEKLQRAVASGDTSGGMHAIADFTKPDVRQSQVVNMFKDAATISNAFENDEEEIFSMPGVLVLSLIHI